MSEQTESTHWANLQESSFDLGIKILIWIYRLFGRSAFRLILKFVVSYYFIKNKIPRHASQDYLNRLGQYYPDLNIKGDLWTSYKHFLSFSETLLDKIIAWMGLIDDNSVEFINRHLLLNLMEQKRGAMILSGHIGNLELCQAIAHIRGVIHLNILVHTHHAEKFNRLLNRNNKNTKIKLIQVTELNPSIAIELQDKINNGEFIVMVGDRTPVQGGRTVKATFLGAEANFPQGAYLLASLLNCPIFTLFCYAEQGHYQVHLEPFSDVFRIPRSEPQRGQFIENLAQRYAEILEKHCHAQPLQWFNFYPFWQSDG